MAIITEHKNGNTSKKVKRKLGKVLKKYKIPNDNEAQLRACLEDLKQKYWPNPRN